MKFGSNKLLSMVLALAVLLALAACAGGSAAQPDDAGFINTYPSQLLTGDVYILKNHERITGNISGVGTTLIIEEGAVVMGDISLVGGSLEIDGRVTGDVNVVAGTAEIGDSAIITGSINQIINQINISPTAVVGGQINTYMFPVSGEQNIGKNVTNLLDWLKPGFWLLLQAIRITGMLIFALIAASLFRQPTLNVAAAVRRSPAVAWGAGLLSMFSIPFIALVLIVTICLSPIGVILLLALLVCVIWSWAVLSNMVGTQMTKWLHLDWSPEGSAVVGALFLGILISTVSLLPVAGFIINLALCSIGLGGVLLSRFGAHSS